MQATLNYSTKLYCENCDENVSVEIAKGTTKEDFAKDNVCPDCGCKTLSLNIKKDTEKNVLYPHIPFMEDVLDEPYDKNIITYYKKEPCMFDNLEPGVYGIYCPCPNCSPTC